MRSMLVNQYVEWIIPQSSKTDGANYICLLTDDSSLKHLRHYRKYLVLLYWNIFLVNLSLISKCFYFYSIWKLVNNVSILHGSSNKRWKKAMMICLQINKNQDQKVNKFIQNWIFTWNDTKNSKSQLNLTLLVILEIANDMCVKLLP